MRCGIGLGIAVAVLSLLGVGCATEDWTQTIFTKRQAEVDQRFGKIETELREQGDRIDGVEVRVNQLDIDLRETRGLLRATAQSPGRIAGAEAKALGSRAAPSTAPQRQPTRSMPEIPRAGRTLVAVFLVHFGFDRADVDVRAEAALKEIVRELHDNPKLTIALEGATDTVGSRDFNMRLSQRRVERVKRFLLDKGVQQARIVSSTGRGPLTDESVKEDLKRRVMVKVMAPEG